MICRICGYEVPDGKKYCPGCGRVITAQDRQRAAEEQKEKEISNTRQIKSDVKTSVYRPAAAKSPDMSQKTIHIPDIFSSDPEAPEYTDPHSYDRATADVLEYDRRFISGSGYEYDDRTQEPIPEPPVREIEEEYYEPENYQYEEDYAEEVYDEPVKNKKPARPHLKLNVKVLVICLIFLAGIAVCVTGVYQIGRQLNFWGMEEPGSNGGENIHPGDSKTDRDEANQPIPDTSLKTGVYTVNSDLNDIFVYRSVTDQRIIATIPNGAVIEITEIRTDFGKTTYGAYSGWVDMDDLEYTPDATPNKTGSDEPTSDDASGESSYPTTTGTYIVATGEESVALNLRGAPSTDGELLTKIPDGTEVTVDKVDGLWGHIVYEEFDGWVYMPYLR